MADKWDERKQAIEDQYFDKVNQDALRRIHKAGDNARTRPSPITGKPMEQVTLMGVVVDRCADSGGVWLDAGELDEILKHVTSQTDGDNRIASFFKRLTSK